MAIYKRYNTRKKKISSKIVVPIVCIAVVFALTVLLGNHLAKKADSVTPQYTGQVNGDSESIGLAPLSEKSLHGVYVDASDLEDFEAEDGDTWASTWLYKDGEPLFATELDASLGKENKKLPSVDALDIAYGTLGLFEVTSLYASDEVKGIVTEYEKALIREFASSGLDEVVLVFNDVTDENYREVLDFASDIACAKVVCVPYEMLKSQEFFSAAADKGLNLALNADGVEAARLENDIDTYAFYFTKYNLRLVISGKATDLVEVLGKHTLLNYQYSSASK